MPRRSIPPPGSIADRYQVAVEMIASLPDAYVRGIVLEAKRRIVQLERAAAEQAEAARSAK